MTRRMDRLEIIADFDKSPDLVWIVFPNQILRGIGALKIPLLSCATWLVVEWFGTPPEHKKNCDDAASCPRCTWDEIEKMMRIQFIWAETQIYDIRDFGAERHNRITFLIAGPAKIIWPSPTHDDPKSTWITKRRPWEPTRDEPSGEDAMRWRKIVTKAVEEAVEKSNRKWIRDVKKARKEASS